MSWQPPHGQGGGPPGPPPQGWGHPPQGPQGWNQQQPGWQPPQGRPPGGQQLPDRSVVILVLGLSSFMALFIGCTACGPLALMSLGLSIPAIVMARRDLAAIDAGRMSPNGRDGTMVGLVLSIASTAISVLVGIAMIGLMLLYGGIFGAAIVAAALGG